jgi:YggT family protein
MSVRSIFLWVLQLYLLTLFARLILDYVRIFSPSWRPRGIFLAAADLVFRLTDPPLKFIGRFVPPLRLGAIAFDMSFIVLYFFLSQVVGRLINLLP